MKIDLLYCTHNRQEMTEATLGYLLKNTNWALIRRVFLYDDMSTDGVTQRIVEAFGRRLGNLFGIDVEIRSQNFGGPVAIMKHYLERGADAELFAKIDSDTAVPFGWLDVCLDVMRRNPDLSLLGIECLSDTAQPVYVEELNKIRSSNPTRAWRESSHIGGIGLMRASAFRGRLNDLQQSGTFFGFTHWQNLNPDVKRGWIEPAIPVALLDRLPFEPWTTHAAESVRRGWARAWPAYPPSRAFLWEWML